MTVARICMVSYMISTVKIGISNIIESQTLSSSCLGSFSGSLFTFLKLKFFKISSKILLYNVNAKQKQPGCKKVRGQSEATMVIGDQKF